MPQTPWHSLPSRTSALLHPNWADVAPHSTGGTQVCEHWGRGTPRPGIPGTYLAVPAPRPPACVPSHRGSAALCLVKPIMHRLYGSASPLHPLLPRSWCLARPGGTGQSLGLIPTAGTNPKELRGSQVCTPIRSPKAQDESLSPHLKFHPLSDPSLGSSLPGWPGFSNPPSGEPGCKGCFPHPWWVLSPSPGCGAERDPWGCSTAPPNPPGQQ